MTDEAIVLAGGKGTRLRSLVSDIPKPMAPINGRPFLEILLAFLAREGFSRIILSVGYKAEVIRSYFGDSYQGMNLTYCVESEPLGTGGSVRFAMEETSQNDFFVLNGDSFADFSRARIVEHLQKTNSPIILGCEIQNTERYGRIISEGSNIQYFREKGVAGPGVISAGVYVLRKSILADMPIGVPFSLERDIFMKLTPASRYQLLRIDGCFIDIGIPEDYRLAQKVLEGFCAQ